MTFSSDPATNTNQLPISLDVNPDEENFYPILLLYLRRVANAVNTKESGLFLLQETASFEQWFSTTPQTIRNGYRTTFDFVALNGGPIPINTTTITLVPASDPSPTQPPTPLGYKYPVQGFGGALDSAGNSYFPSDPNVTVSYLSSTGTFTIINNTGNALTQFYWCMEYLKN